MASLFLLTLGAEGLVRGSASLAIRAGLTPLIVGLTIVAFGTSAPELVVSISASVNNQPDIAIGNVVGSNIFNIGIILGLTALFCPVKISSQVIKYDAPIMIAATIIIMILLLWVSLSRLTGIILAGTLVVYTVIIIRLARNESSEKVAQQFDEGVPSISKSLLIDLLFIVGGLVLLVAGSRLLVASATDIARMLRVSEAVIGLTIIAAGTSMPELATSLVAAIRKQPDIAVGNVVGSNLFNILGILGVSSVVKPLKALAITPLDLAVMMAFAVALYPLMYTESKLQRWEGALLLTGYSLYLFSLWPSI